MLELPPLGSNTVAYQYWTPAYSIRSILLQMTSFILSDDQPNHTYQGGQTRCIEEMNEFVCNTCSHTHQKPFPPFPSLNQIRNSPLSYPPIEITGETARKLQDKMFRSRCISEIKNDKNELLICDVPVNSIEEIISPVIKPTIIKEDWVRVGKNKISNEYCSPLVTFSSYSSLNPSISDNSTSNNNTTLSNNGNIYEILNAQEKIECVKCMKYINIANFSKSQIKKDQSICKLCIINSTTKNTSSNNIAINDKNYEKRRKKRESLKKLLIEASTTKTTVEIKKVVNKVVSTKLDQQLLISQQGENNVNDNVTNNYDDNEPPEQWKSGWGNQNMGSFSILSRDIVAGEICSYLTGKETLDFGSTCRGGSIVSNDWFVWKRLLHYKFPRSALSPVPILKNSLSSFISDQQSLNQVNNN
jgi:hypothetical protein